MADEKLFSFDRCEGEMAVLVDDDGSSVSVSLTALPDDSCEGMMFRQTAGGYVPDREETQLRRRRALELQHRLRRKR